MLDSKALIGMMSTLCWMACSSDTDRSLDTSNSSVRTASRTPARPCRADGFYVDVPVNVVVPWSDTSFLSGVRSQLLVEANAAGKPWFCGADEISCPAGAVSVDVSSLLPQRTSPPSRADGHLRFFRIGFNEVAQAGATRLSVRPEAWCDVVDTIRSTFETETSIGAPDILLVGRECDASVAGVEGAPSTEMLSWHLDRMGLSSADLNVSPPRPGTERVDLGLIDSGILPAVASGPNGLGVASNTDEVHSAGLHVHGTAMAILARQLAPTASLHASRAMEASGAGTSASVARAIDGMLFDGASAKSTRPLVMNLSFGWPAELGGPAKLYSASCQTHEDVFGEPIRYLLDVARRIDVGGHRRIFVASSAGNQALSLDPTVFAAAPNASVPQTNCGGSTTPMYFPAAWDQIDTCHDNDPSLPGRTRVVLAVSAVDDQQRQAGISIPGSETPLVAPGQHVYAANSNAPLTSVAPVCAGSQTLFPPPVTLPVVLSGTSVSAALVSGAAARAQSAIVAAGGSALNRDALARLMYLTGTGLCRTTASGVAVRQLNVARLDRAIASCPAVVQCAAQAHGSEIISAALLASCGSQLVACGLESRRGAPMCTTTAPVAWPSNYLTHRAAACETRTITPVFEDALACGASCPYNTGVPQVAMGPIGPQPDGPVCPDCPGLFDVAGNQLTLLLEFSSDFEAGTTFESPYLLLSGPDSANPSVMTKVYVDLLQGASPESFAPGKHVDLELDLATGGIDWIEGEVEAALIIDVIPAGGKATTDYSALRLKLY